jgi:hypothetical protein
MRIKLFLSTLLIASFATSCSLRPDGGSVASQAQDDWKMGVFTKGNFIPDVKPLSPRNENDLREVAMSLPIWESDLKTTERWVMENSKPGVGVDQWTNPADGAQSAVTIRRLADSGTGATRVAVDHPSLMIFTPSGGRYLPWSATLERRRGGWQVMDAIKHK